MKLLACSAAAALLASTGAASAAPPAEKPAEQLRNSLNEIALQTRGQNRNNPPGQSARPNDPDQGDDNAARRAILEVCYKNTPASERAAICDGEPTSPE